MARLRAFSKAPSAGSECPANLSGCRPAGEKSAAKRKLRQNRPREFDAGVSCSSVTRYHTAFRASLRRGPKVIATRGTNIGPAPAPPAPQVSGLNEREYQKQRQQKPHRNNQSP